MGCANSGSLAINDVALLNEKLTSEQIQLLKKSWDLIPEKETEFGLSIMIRIFLTHPEIKYIWIFAKDLTTEPEMRSSNQLMYHGAKIIGVVANMLLSYEANGNVDQYAPLVDRLGKSHFHYGVKREHFLIFEDAFMFCLKKHVKDHKELSGPESRKAWHSFMLKIGDMISNAMDKEAKLDAAAASPNQ